MSLASPIRLIMRGLMALLDARIARQNFYHDHASATAKSIAR